MNKPKTNTTIQLLQVFTPRGWELVTWRYPGESWKGVWHRLGQTYRNVLVQHYGTGEEVRRETRRWLTAVGGDKELTIGEVEQ